MKAEEWADPTILDDLHKYGKFDINACLNCGGCTIVCSLSSNGTTFSPRRVIQYARLGLKDKLRSSLDPWLCHYCGECSTSCPRQTETGESMMTLRRYLASQYDWIGFSSILFKSKVAKMATVIIVALAMLALIILFYSPPWLLKFGRIFTVIPIPVIGLLFFIPNILRMYWFTLGRNSFLKLPLSLYLGELKTLVLHATTQSYIRKCKEKSFWSRHWFVAAGDVLIIGAVAVTGWPATTYTYPPYHPFNLWGIVASLMVLISAGILMIERLKRRRVMYRFSDLSDWLTLTLLFGVVFLVLLSYICLSSGLKGAGYVLYAAFLVLLAPWALVFMPFGKPPHPIYRPLAIYFHAVKEKASQMKPGREGKLPFEGVGR